MHILLNCSAMFDIATHMSRSISILLRYFDLITITAEKPASHKYEVANGKRTQRSLQPTSGNLNRALTQNKISQLGLYMLFKVMSEERSINCSASFQRCKLLRGICIINKRILIQLCFSMSSEKYFSKCEIRASKCEQITIFISHSSIFFRERLPDCELKWDFKVENYQIACHLSAGQFSTTVVFF